MVDSSRRSTKPLSASSSVSDLSFEDIRLEEVNRVSSNRTGTERSASVGLPARKASLMQSESNSGGFEQTERTRTDEEAPALDEISWRGAAPPPAGPALPVDSVALRENLATLAGQAANTAGQAANTLSDATLAASSKVLLSSVRGREILMEKLSKQIPPQAGSWFAEGLTNWSSGLTDTVHTGLSAVQQMWTNADSSMKSTPDKTLIAEPKDSEEVRALFGLSAEEELMETFPCHLLQKYVCTENNCTDDKQVPFPGRLYMTGHHICFHCEPLPHFTLPLKSLQYIKKATEAGQDVVRLETNTNQKLIFGHFNDLEVDNFLALAWHFTSDSR